MPIWLLAITQLCTGKTERADSFHFLRANAAAIPPATSPTAVAAMPMPITPSTSQKIENR